MSKRTRRKLSMGRSALNFCLAHPWEKAQYTRVVTQLQQLIERGSELGTQRGNGDRAINAMTVSKAELALTIRKEYLVPLNRIARAARPDRAELPKRFRLPKDGVNAQEFMATARAMLKEAESERELFESYGLPESFLADLAGALRAYDEVVEEQDAGRALRVGATADSKGVAGDVMHAVAKLDAMNRNRFAHDRERLAAWMSARNVAWPEPSAPVEEATASKPGGAARDSAA